MDLNDELIQKAKRRIKRQLLTGENQARVHVLENKLIEYKAKHHIFSLIFSVDTLNRLRLRKTNSNSNL